MGKKQTDAKTNDHVNAQPRFHQRATEIQPYGTVGDDGTNDLVVSEVLRRNELQVWFLSEHLVDVPLVRALKHSETIGAA